MDKPSEADKENKATLELSGIFKGESGIQNSVPVFENLFKGNIG